MADDLERLVVQLSADIKKYENAINRAQGLTNKRLGDIQRKAASASSAISSSFARTGAAITAGFAAAGGAAGAKELLDSATRIDNALKVAGLSGQELETTYQALYASAVKNAAPIETLVELYSRLSLVSKELNVGQETLRGFVDNIAVALRAGGTSATEASGALTQLSQALGGGVVHAEEFQSILEGTPSIARAVAAGLQETGGSVARLRELVIDGKVSSQAFFAAFQAGAPVLQEQVAGSVLTIDQRLGNLQTALINAAREFNQSAQAGETFGNEIDRVSDFVNSINFESLIAQIKAVTGALNEGIATVDGFASALGRLSGLENVGKFLTGGAAQKSFFGGALTVTSPAAITDRINSAFEGEIKKAGDLTAEGIRQSVLGGGPATTPTTERLPEAPKVKPVSIADYAVPEKPKKGGGGGRKGRKGGESDYQRETDQIKERIAALNAETAAQATVNPLIDDYGYAAERASTAQGLLTAAQHSGLAVGKELTDVQQLLAGNFEGLSPKAREQAEAILQLADANAKAVSQAGRLQESQQKMRDAMDDFKNTSKDVLSGFISDIRNGTSVTDALSNALNKVLDKLIEMSLNSIFDGGGNIFSGLFGGLGGGGAFPPAPAPVGNGLFDKGGYTGNGGKYEPAGIVHKGEYVIPADVVRRVGVRNLEKLRGYANGGLVGRGSGSGRLGGPEVKLNIINNTGAQVSQRTRQTSQGPQLDVMIDEAVAAKLNTPGSKTRSAAKSQFGLKNGLASR